MDLHGNIEFMLFEKQLEKLEDINNNEDPVGFFVSINKDDMFTRIACRKVLTLKEVNKQRTNKMIEEKSQEPLVLDITLSNDINFLDKLYILLVKYPGKRVLKLSINSTLQNVLINTSIKVNDEVLKELKAFDEISVA